jgi:hypothetical protein
LANAGATIDDADVPRVLARVARIRARGVPVPSGVDLMLKAFEIDVTGDGPLADGFTAAQQAFKNVDPRKRRKNESRAAYLGAGSVIDSHLDGPGISPEKRQRRTEKVLDLKNGTWSWLANDEWVNQADKTFGRFKLLADEIPDWVRGILSRADATGAQLLTAVHDHYKDKTEKADLYHTADGENRFTYFCQELASLLDKGYRLQASGGKLLMTRQPQGSSAA